MKFKLFLAKYGFWLVVGGIIVGVYGYGMYVRHNAAHTLDTLIQHFLGGEWFLDTIGVGDDITAWVNSIFSSEEVFSDFKNSEVYALMDLPQKIQFNLAFQTKKTMPIAIIAIILIALVMRTKFSATVDIYAAERQAALDEIRGVAPVEVEAKIIDVKEDIPSIEVNQPLIESKEDNSDGMNIF